jgi:hypothetical protein
MIRPRTISGQRFSSADEADRHNRDEEAARSAEEGLEILERLRNQYWELYVGRQPRLQRVCRVLDQPRS